ncbi:MAG: pitrilysin family protein, partial [Melioribacteraceae bacterium]|nr:pitrilysin family protein [Melioribacteraceae bacterium]
MIDRKIKPEPEGKVEVNLPEIKEIRLSNSLQLYYVKKDTLPIVQLNLIVPSGSIYDGTSLGLSNLTSMLIDEAAGGLTGLEISEQLDSLGSILNINSNKEYTTLSILSLEENFTKSLDIFAKILISPDFNESDFKRERERLNAQILNLNNDPAYLASAELNRVVYDTTPYQFPTHGLVDTLSELNRNDIKSFYDKRYFPSGSFLIAVGSMKEEEFISVAENYFNQWSSQGNNELKAFELNTTDKSIILLDKPDAAQSEIRVGHFSKGRKSKDFYARTVLNSV